MSKTDSQVGLLPLFESRRTERGTRTIKDQIDQLYTGPAAGKYGWMPAIIYLFAREYDKALSEGERYLTTIENTQGNNSEKVACGLLVLKLIYTNLKRPKEAAFLDERFESIRNNIGDTPIHQILIEASYELAVVYQGQHDPRSNQRAFTTACVTLALSVLVYGRRPPELMTRLFLLLQSLGFAQDRWEWLIRRCDFRFTDFVGLISVLIDEEMFPSEATEVSDSSESDSEDCKPAKKIEISCVKEQSWMTPAFSEDFLISLTEGELSMRVEQLLEEGSRWFRDLGGLSDIVILFSSDSSGNHITVLERDTSSDNKMEIFDMILDRRLAQYGADSAMAVALETFRIEEPDMPPTPDLGFYAEEKIVVEARDSKSYVRGMQRIHRTLGSYESEEPVLFDTKSGWFSKFTFPVKPRIEKALTRTDPERP